MYGDAEVNARRQKDRRQGAIIDQLGHLCRIEDPDLFSAVVHHIIGQQISTRAQQTIWHRLQQRLGTIDADTALAAKTAELQAAGMSFRKAGYLSALPNKSIRERSI